MRKADQEDLRLDSNRFLGRRTLIVGDVNVGKTTLTNKILEAMCHEGLGERIVALDLAPEIPMEILMKKGLSGVGGWIRVPEEKGILYLRPTLRPPRLMAKSPEDALSIAKENLRAIEQVLSKALCGRDILFVNDLTLYLHAGEAVGLMEFLSKFDTVVANGYRGEKLGEGSISSREREQLEKVTRFFDLVIELC